MGTVLQAISTLGLSVGLSMYYQWKLGLVALSFAPFILLATFMQTRLMRGENDGYQEALEKSTKVSLNFG